MSKTHVNYSIKERIELSERLLEKMEDALNLIAIEEREAGIPITSEVICAALSRIIITSVLQIKNLPEQLRLIHAVHKTNLTCVLADQKAQATGEQP